MTQREAKAWCNFSCVEHPSLKAEFWIDVACIILFGHFVSKLMIEQSQPLKSHSGMHFFFVTISSLTG